MKKYAIGFALLTIIMSIAWAQVETEAAKPQDVYFDDGYIQITDNRFSVEFLYGIKEALGCTGSSQYTVGTKNDFIYWSTNSVEWIDRYSRTQILKTNKSIAYIGSISSDSLMVIIQLLSTNNTRVYKLTGLFEAAVVNNFEGLK